MALGATPLLTLSVIATTALTQARAVTGTGALPAAGARCLGIARTNGAIGERIPVDVDGTAVVEAGAAIAVDAALELDATGRVITKASGVTVGRALSAASAAGQMAEVLLIAN
ncbi:MAG: DUF2190 family protein [Burkholderiales bacterium]|nr:DUF2190 family protein [Burkholderiales bacterium]